MIQPPPLPASATRQAGKSFSHYAAIASCCAPVLGIGLNALGVAALSSVAEDAKRGSLVLLGVAASLLILVGLFLGIFGLCHLSTYGRKGLLAPALSGTLINGALLVGALAIFLPRIADKLQEAQTNRQNLDKVKQAEAELQKATRQELSAKGGSQNVADNKIDNLQKTLQNAAQNMTGDDALVMHASSAYLDRLGGLRKTLVSATTALTTEKVLVARDLVSKEQLQNRREAVRAFIKANDELKDYVVHGVENFRAEMVRAHVPDKSMESTMRGFREQAVALNPLIVQVRDCDGRMGATMLGLIDLEETEWGKWDAQSKPGKIIFQDDSAREKYNALMAEIRAEIAEEKKAQARVLASQSSQ